MTFGLTLYNTEAVKLLLKENPRMVPNKRIKSESNRTYDARMFNRYVMQGIIRERASTTSPCRRSTAWQTRKSTGP